MRFGEDRDGGAPALGRTLREGLEAFQHRWPDVTSGSQESPIFLMAAGWRTGSTLLQRMLARDCLMWGEPYAEGGLLESIPDLLKRIRPRWPEDSYFFHGQDGATRSRDFVANLYPSPDALLNGYVRFFETLFSDPAQSAGIPRWGVKTVRLTADYAYFFRWLFPHARFLFLTRNPYHAFRSYYTIAKRRGVRWFDRWPDRPLTPERFARHWKTLTQSFLDHADQLGATFVRFEDVLADDADLTPIESYLGAPFTKEALDANPGNFPLPDQRLAEREYERIAEAVEPLAESLGYLCERPPQAAPPPELPRTEVESEQIRQLYKEALAAHRGGELEIAEERYREILEKTPIHAGAWHFLGVLQLARGDRDVAREHIERALAICDTKPVYWNNYGALLKEAGQLHEAEAALHRALDLNEDYADAWANLGHAQELLNLSATLVERSYRNALKLAPTHVDAAFRLADYYQTLGRHAEAAQSYRRAVELDPDRPEGKKRLLEALISARNWGEARQIVEQELALRPNDPASRLALLKVQLGLEDIDGVRDTCRAMVLAGAGPPIWKWKHLGVCPPVFPDDAAVDRYWTQLETELTESLADPLLLDWRNLPADGYTPSFNLPHHGRCCRKVREMIAARFEPAFPRVQFPPRQGRPVRVGFLITAGHEGGFLRGMSAVVARLDPRLEIVVFCADQATKRFQAKIRRDDVRYIPLPARFDHMVDAVRAAQCDVLYFWKVGPDPLSYFLGMARLAPVQCTSSGCHGTTGVAAIDYYLSSPLMESPDTTVDPGSHYSERLFLFDKFAMFQSRQPRPDDVTRSEFNLPEKGAIYLCPHRLAKYCPAFDAYLREILDRDPRGSVVLLAGASEHGRQALHTRMQKNLGDACFRRVHLLPSLAVKQYYRLFRLATLVLDTPVYASSLTAYDAFSAGVPVLTESGPLAVQNYATGLYRWIDMVDELVARGKDDFVAKAVAIGTDPDLRAGLAATIDHRSDVVFDDASVVGEYERFISQAESHYS